MTEQHKGMQKKTIKKVLESSSRDIDSTYLIQLIDDLEEN